MLTRSQKQKLAAARSADEADEILAARTPIELAQYLSAMQAKTFTKMSALELEDLRIPVDAIADTTIWSGPRTGDKIGEFIVKVLPALWLRLGQKPKNKGAPTLIYVVGAALRAADLTRCLRAANLRGTKGGDVAKLFAKHFKITDQATYLSRTLIGSAVGTPGRIGKLLNMDALSTSALSHIILDTSYRDAKKRNLLDIPETRDELFVQVLSYPKILRGLKEGKMQVVFF
ncbi:hypothetical protein FISHEDRAFT_38204 [Fistulina hepatica ATCC 64428]|nr:hypothetical protein FISHEDRAFT_38204 [Fistulina hepatica ATCC 64428]